MRKPANRLGKDFLQSVLGIGVGFERGWVGVFGNIIYAQMLWAI